MSKLIILHLLSSVDSVLLLMGDDLLQKSCNYYVTVQVKKSYLKLVLITEN